MKTSLILEDDLSSLPCQRWSWHGHCSRNCWCCACVRMALTILVLLTGFCSKHSFPRSERCVLMAQEPKVDRNWRMKWGFFAPLMASSSGTVCLSVCIPERTRGIEPELPLAITCSATPLFDVLLFLASLPLSSPVFPPKEKFELKSLSQGSLFGATHRGTHAVDTRTVHLWGLEL